jgi:hypothetical protein
MLELLDILCFVVLFFCFSSSFCCAILLSFLADAGIVAVKAMICAYPVVEFDECSDTVNANISVGT